MPLNRILLAAALAAFTALGLRAGDGLFNAIRNDDLSSLKKQLAAHASVDLRGPHGTTPLMLASAFGSAEAMRLLIEGGADVNAHNDFGATSLMWSVYDIHRIRLLLDRYVDVNAATKAKETALLIASSQPDGEAVVRLLLARGANFEATDEKGVNALLAASEADNPAMVRLFLDKGLDANSADKDGNTPLIWAAQNGDVETASLLLKRGANVNAVSGKPSFQVKNGIINLGNFTPLLMASSYGPTELVKLLLDAGAHINARDARGATPLILSVTSEFQDPATVRLLLARGADPAVKMETGETARDWAVKFGFPDAIDALRGPSRAALAPVSFHEPKDTRAAAIAGLAIMEKTSSSFFTTGGCVSCHAQNMTGIVTNAARANGIPVDPAASGERLKILQALWGGLTDPLLQRLDPPGGMDTIEHSLFQFMAEGYPAADITSAMVHNLAAQQRADGSWRFDGLARAPVSDGDAPRTAMAVRAIQVYGPAGRKVEFAERIERARAWLLGVKPKCIDERNFQLLGLKWSGAPGAAIQPRARDLIAEQHPDGGWAQNRYLASDAYATGQALYVLREAAGLSASDPVYARGVQFLLKTQTDDGSWHVQSRAVKFQPYFESGFPHHHDQWISQMATGWATLALSLAQPKPAL